MEGGKGIENGTQVRVVENLKKKKKYWKSLVATRKLDLMSSIVKASQAVLVV